MSYGYNNHGNTLQSIMDALSGILWGAESSGASEDDCDEVRSEILLCILKCGNIKTVKTALQDGQFTVLTDGGFMDIGYLLSLRF